MEEAPDGRRMAEIIKKNGMIPGIKVATPFDVCVEYRKYR